MRALRSAIQALPPVARRDAAIAELKERLRRTQRQRDRAHSATQQAHEVAEQAARDGAQQAAKASDEPSWRLKRAESWRRRLYIRELGYGDPVWKINSKAAGYRFARSHGLDVPDVLFTYKNVRDIPWNDLPDRFVVKAVNGAGSHGVVPLERDGEQVVDLLDVANGPKSIDDVIAYFEEKVAKRSCSPNGVVEELLRSPYPDDDRPIAPDLKLYCFYGVVGMIMIRDVNGSRNMRNFRIRYVDAEGKDLGEAILGRGADPAVPGPVNLKSVVDVGERVSAAIPTPFIRLDLYERPDSVVFGEVTPRPGGDQILSPDLDREFGRLWEEAEGRLRAEVIAEGNASVRYGDRTEAASTTTTPAREPGATDPERIEIAADKPSWEYKLAESSRLRPKKIRYGDDIQDPVWQINDKVSGYAFGRSHGFDVPEQIAAFDDFEDIAWNELPEAFVIKTVHGAGSHGVVPIERHGDKVLDLLNVRQGQVEISDVIDYLNGKNAKGKCGREVVLEELLRSPHDNHRVAPDLKLYCFYGVVGMTLLRDVKGSRHPAHYSTRFIDADGNDLGEAIVGRPVDPSLPLPLHLDDVVRAGELLSAAVPAPFLRVDLYEQVDRVVFGEVTPGPGGSQKLRPELDRRLGKLWERAEIELRTEAITQKGVGVRYGDAG